MTDWKPKFKVGDVVVSANSGRRYWVPIDYMLGTANFWAWSLDKANPSLFGRSQFDESMSIVDTPEPAPSATTPTKPNYYRFEVRGVPVDIIDVIQGLGLGCEAGNVYKYLARAGKKDASKHIEDLEKAREWLDRLIEYRHRS